MRGMDKNTAENLGASLYNRDLSIVPLSAALTVSLTQKCCDGGGDQKGQKVFST